MSLALLAMTRLFRYFFDELKSAARGLRFCHVYILLSSQAFMARRPSSLMGKVSLPSIWLFS